MHYAISHQSLRQDFLCCTPRRKLLKHTLLFVREGLVLAKLGKQEYAIEKGEAFWLPFDALCSLTYFPSSHIQLVEVSSRVRSRMPKQGGYVELEELTTAILNKLSQNHVNAESQQALLAVLRNELASTKTTLYESAMTQHINHWRWDCKLSELTSEQQLVMKVREANKMMLSGQKREQIINKLFSGDSAAFAQLETLLLGK
ncbi:AraC family transcriptional regulator [Vibrio japonicus]|uniref:AraC family transcriptional regulator n=1 Tax=Vibrio japonicus TaxID=1824638 RepID=A0ABY5LLX6_9VIBR|nr:AraC family transcriptional regulator [Vibrio japonicus]UUM32127.1 AraC family transcriptional regulator [Vibrio japonicus]